jgi:hypothetical protein
MQIELDPEKDFHVVINGVATALSLDALDDAYQADSISDDTLIWQEGLDEWMRLDTLLVALSEQEVAPSEQQPAAQEDNFSVMVAPDDIKAMTLEQLADAHRLGVVHEATPVWQPGTTDWVPLSVIIAGCAAGEHVSAAPSLPPTQQVAPAPSMHAGAAPMAQAPSAAPSQAPGSLVSLPDPAPHSGFAAAPMSVPPSSIAPSAPNSLAPTAASIAPMSQGIGLAASADSLLDDLEFPQPTGSPWIKRSLIGLGSLAAVFVIYQASSGSAGEEAPQVDGVAVQAVSAAAVVEEEKAEPSAWEQEQAMLEKARLADEAAAKDGSGSTADAFSARLAGEQETKKDTPARAKSKWRPKAKKASGSKSSKYDPMNGAL